MSEFTEPPIGIYFDNEVFVCYRAHTPTPKCEHSQKCSHNISAHIDGETRGISKVTRSSERDWNDLELCFESIYVCKTELGRPLEIAFISDIFTLLIR